MPTRNQLAQWAYGALAVGIMVGLIAYIVLSLFIPHVDEELLWRYFAQ